MSHEEKIRNALERNTKAISMRRSIGKGTAVTKVRVTDGLTCEIEDGAWKLVADMSEKWGGNDRGPNPGVYGRAALGSCLAMGYAMWAARRGVPITALEVEIQADYDTGAAYGVDDETPPGYSEVRYVVHVESEAPEEEVMRLLDEADRHTPYLDVFGRAQRLVRTVRFGARQR